MTPHPATVAKWRRWRADGLTIREVADRDQVSYWVVREQAREVGGRTGPPRIPVGVEDAVAAYIEAGSATRAAALLSRRLAPISLTTVRLRLWEAGVFDTDPTSRGRPCPHLLTASQAADARDRAAAAMATRARTDTATGRILDAWDRFGDIDAVRAQLPDIDSGYVRTILRMHHLIEPQPSRVDVTPAQARAAVKRYGNITAAARALGVSRNAIAARVEPSPPRRATR